MLSQILVQIPHQILNQKIVFVNVCVPKISELALLLYLFQIFSTPSFCRSIFGLYFISFSISIPNSLALVSKFSALVFPKIFYFSASIGISLVSTFPSSPVFLTFKVGVVDVVVPVFAVVLVIPALFKTELDVSIHLAFIAERSTLFPLFN